jgi:hypothetical protein
VKRWAVARAALVGIALGCLIDPPLLGARSEGVMPSGSRTSPTVLIVVAGAALLLMILTASVRAWLAASGAARRLARLGAAPAASLVTAAATLDIHSAICVDSDDRTALCAGVLHPRIFVGRGLVDALTDQELLAVIAHEASHARRRDPLRRAFCSALAEVLFFIPLVQWWAARDRIRSELIADAAAVRACGRGPLARALLVAGGTLPVGVATISGDAGVRVAHLLGEPLRLPRPPFHVWPVSIAGAGAAVVAVVCVATILT